MNAIYNFDFKAIPGSLRTILSIWDNGQDPVEDHLPEIVQEIAHNAGLPVEYLHKDLIMVQRTLGSDRKWKEYGIDDAGSFQINMPVAATNHYGHEMYQFLADLAREMDARVRNGNPATYRDILEERKSVA